MHRAGFGERCFREFANIQNLAIWARDLRFANFTILIQLVGLTIT